MITIQKILDVDYGQELKFTLGKNSAIFGSKLEVQLPVSASKWLCNEISPKRIEILFYRKLEFVYIFIYCHIEFIVSRGIGP